MVAVMSRVVTGIFCGMRRIMKRGGGCRQRIFAGLSLSLLVFDGPAAAADMPFKAPIQNVFDWTGFYVGAHAGFSRGFSRTVLSDPLPAATGNTFDGMVGGVQAGYNYKLTSGLLLGIEADFSFPNYLTSNS